MRKVVVLPEPFGPRNPVIRPGSTVNEKVVDGQHVPEVLGEAADLDGKTARGGADAHRGDPSASDPSHTVGSPSWRKGPPVGRARSGGCAALDELVGEQQADRDRELVVDPRPWWTSR